MNIFFEKPTLILFTLCGVISFLGFSSLYRSRNSSNLFFRKWFFIPARKSKTNAVQLGGLPLAFTLIVGLVYSLIDSEISMLYGVSESKMIIYWLVSSVGIVGYGYLDDKYELRPTVKLALQIFWVFMFSFATSLIYSSHMSSIAFVITFVTSLAVLNGSNLLDGLDTMTLKNSLAIYSAYLFLGIYFKSTSIILVSCLAIIPLFSFWFYNREPSKVHLGEIGGTFIGFSYILLSSLSFKTIDSGSGTIDGYFMAIIPLSLPIIEISVSILRRVYNGKSMFKGDQKHIHHILTKYKHFSHTKASSIIGGVNLITMAFGIAVGLHFNTVIGACSVYLAQSLIMLSVAKKYWTQDHLTEITAKSIFANLRKKNITVIETSYVENFKLTILKGEKIDDEDEEDENDKMAS